MFGYAGHFPLLHTKLVLYQLSNWFEQKKKWEKKSILISVKIKQLDQTRV